MIFTIYTSLFAILGFSIDYSFGFSTGPGSCAGGAAPLGGTHIRGGAEIIGPLSDYDVVVKINDVTLTPGTSASFPPNVDLAWNVATTNPIQFKGFFLRVETTGIPYTLATTNSLYKKDDLYCPVITTSNVQGISHNSAELKSAASGTMRFDGEGAVGIEITIVYRNGFVDPDNQSLNGFDQFSINIEPAQVTEAPVPIPTEAPVVAPTTDAPVVAPATDAPVLIPTTDSPVVAPTTELPVAAPTIETPVPSLTIDLIPTTAPSLTLVPSPTPLPGTPDPTIETDEPTVEPNAPPPTPVKSPITKSKPPTQKVSKGKGGGTKEGKSMMKDDKGMMKDGKGMSMTKNSETGKGGKMGGGDTKKMMGMRHLR